MADRPADAEALGLKDGYNYVEIDEDNWKATLDYYAASKQHAQTVAEQGRKLALERHSHKVRAQEFITMLREF